LKLNTDKRTRDYKQGTEYTGHKYMYIKCFTIIIIIMLIVCVS